VQPVVQAIDLCKRFGSTLALDTVSLQVMPGEIHALVGRNGAGKSTLVSILAGLLRADAGRVERSSAPACVYQHSKLVPQLSVAENVFLNRCASMGPFVDWPRVRAQTHALLAEWDLGISPDAAAESLSVEERQMVEIVRALSMGARFIILDEPTARLDARGIERLFARLRVLRDRGAGILFISHHLQEIYDLCDDVTVLRDGKHICTAGVADLGHTALIEAMTGESRGDAGEAAAPLARGEERLRVDALCGGDLEGVSFSVRRGEIVGLAGTGASAKTAIAETIAGLRKARSGSIRIDGRNVGTGNVRDAIAAGIGFVPRDRHRDGMVGTLSVEENLTMTVADRFGKFGFISPKRRRDAARLAIARLGIAARGDQFAEQLSGGNQQKVVLGRALARGPRVLVMIDPTAGVDVKSKEALLAEIDEVRRTGTSVVLASDDTEDLRICDRVLIVRGGRIDGELSAGWHENDLIARMEGIA
jgi:simple sugar transport system ATP-binding protein